MTGYKKDSNNININLLGVVLKIPADGEPGSIFDNCDVVLVGVTVPVVPP